MITIGFAGTAKNTGKTTTARRVLSILRAVGLKTALTSIGYDGENLDNVTGLPKPRYTGYPGLLAATARDCLKTSTASVRILEQTPIQTILGPVVIVEILHPGTILLAGPNRGEDLAHLFQLLIQYGVERTLVDGALNRLVPLICTDQLVLSTGAAFDPDIETIARHIHAVSALFSLPKTTSHAPDGAKICLNFRDHSNRCLHMGSLLSPETVHSVTTAIDRPVQSLIIPGACTPARVEDLCNQTQDRLQGVEMVFGSPLKLIASANPVQWLNQIQTFHQRGSSISFLETLPLRLITVNPFYPRCTSGGGYEPAYIDKEVLLHTVQEKLHPLPVVNIEDCLNTDLIQELELDPYARPIY